MLFALPPVRVDSRSAGLKTVSRIASSQAGRVANDRQWRTRRLLPPIAVVECAAHARTSLAGGVMQPVLDESVPGPSQLRGVRNESARKPGQLA